MRVGDGLRNRDFEIGVGPSPDQREPRRPILAIDGSARPGKCRFGQDAGCGRKFRAGDFSTNGAGRDANFRMVANSLELSHIAASHDIQAVICLDKPDRSRYASSIPAECCQ